MDPTQKSQEILLMSYLALAEGVFITRISSRFRFSERAHTRLCPGNHFASDSVSDKSFRNVGVGLNFASVVRDDGVYAVIIHLFFACRREWRARRGDSRICYWVPYVSITFCRTNGSPISVWNSHPCPFECEIKVRSEKRASLITSAVEFME